MKRIALLFGVLIFATSVWAQVPKVKIEYSYALDIYCPERVEPEVLNSWQLSLIAKIPTYRTELLKRLPWFQQQWDNQGQPLLTATRSLIGKAFPMQDLQAAVFLCPRFPFMGTPLALNVISYLESSAADIPTLGGQPLPVFFFVSTTFHEVLHKYINAILEKQPSSILAAMDESDLYEAHLHLFALQKFVFTSLGLSNLLVQIEGLEATHGPDYSRAWKRVHGDQQFYEDLLAELMK